jgi:esterase/lipase superfamily enzyme
VIVRLRLFVCLTLLALAACTAPTYTPLLQGSSGGPAETVFVATTRAEDDTGRFTGERGRGTTYLSVPVNFPRAYAPGQPARIVEVPDPETDFSVGSARRFDGPGFRAAVNRALADEPPGKREVTVYVHGYFNAFYTGVFRAAQLKQDFGLDGAMVHFAWPSRGSTAGYAYDRESLLYSRDAMERFLRDIATLNADRVNVVAHSLGAMLVMETLRQIEIDNPDWVRANIDGIAFVSPDIDIEVFKSQAARFRALPEDFVIFVSDRDRVLLLSSRYSGVRERLGNTRDVEVSTEGELTIVDLTALADTAESRHFIPATSPTAIRILQNSGAFADFFPRDGIGLPIGRGVRLLQLPAE